MVFAIMYASDIGKAEMAARRIFNIIDTPSKIDPLSAEEKAKEEKGKRRVEKEGKKGVIEFEEVWFRYPSRKEQWVLKKFSLRIEAN